MRTLKNSNSRLTGPTDGNCLVIAFVDFSLDSQAIALHPELSQMEKATSIYRYGAKVGVARLLDALTEYDVHATWAVSTHVAKMHPRLVTSILARGHEMAFAPTSDQVSRIGGISDSLAALRARIPQQDVRGLYAPVARFPITAGDLLKEDGIQWTSVWGGDDAPYRHPETPSLIEFPIEFSMMDSIYLRFNLNPPSPPAAPPISGYDEMFSNWHDEYHQALQSSGYMAFQISPELIGTGAGLKYLKLFISEIRSTGGTICTVSDAREQLSESLPNLNSHHPARIFHELYGKRRKGSND